MTCSLAPPLPDSCFDCGHHRLVHEKSGCLICNLLTLAEALIEREKELARAALILSSAADVHVGGGITEVSARFPSALLDAIAAKPVVA